MKRYCFALDLNDDAALIAEYEHWHRNVWPEIIQSINGSGITGMQIYRTGNRLFMIMDTTDDFSFDQKATADATNSLVQDWEQLMWKFQKPVPWAKDGEKWVMMDKVFELQDYTD